MTLLLMGGEEVCWWLALVPPVLDTGTMAATRKASEWL